MTEALQEGSRAGGRRTRDDFRICNLHCTPTRRYAERVADASMIQRAVAGRQLLDGSPVSRGNNGSDPTLASCASGMAQRDGGFACGGGRGRKKLVAAPRRLTTHLASPVAANSSSSAPALLQARRCFSIAGFWPTIKSSSLASSTRSAFGLLFFFSILVLI